MQNEYRNLDNNQIALLDNLIGATLESIDAVLADNSNTAWNTVRVHTSNGSIDINCFLEELAINDEGDVDEFGIVSVQNAPNFPLEVEAISADTTKRDVNKEITGINIVTNTLETFYGNNQLVHRETVQAIIFELDSSIFLALDREVWFEEELTIKWGNDLDGLIFDDSESWEDNPDDTMTRFNYSTKIDRLS